MLRVSVVVPAYNAERTLARCLEALERQTMRREDFEVIVVDDGSTDRTAEVAAQFAGVRVIRQRNQGPAAARNLGAREAGAHVVAFTDSDCEPTPTWLEAQTAPFADPRVVGSKGAYLTRQRSVTARFTQLEYEDKYDRMSRFPVIDFIDTYAAAFRRDVFLAAGGYDVTFPVPCAEDVDLSYRLAATGHKLVFVPGARVYHLHPERLGVYLRRKYRYAYWRMLAVRKSPKKIISDSHSPQTNKAQVILVGPLAVLAALALLYGPAAWAFLGSAAAYGALSLPFVVKAVRKDPLVGLASPILLLLRSGFQGAGLLAGTIRQSREAMVR